MNLTHKWRILQVWNIDQDRLGYVVQYQDKSFLWFKEWKNIEYDDVKRLQHKYSKQIHYDDWDLAHYLKGGLMKVIFRDEHKANEAVILLDEMFFQSKIAGPSSPIVFKEMGPTEDMTYEEVIAREG